MELVAGRPLDRLIADGGLPSDRLVAYGRQITAALMHAHGRGVVHRDLKSANILVSDDGGVKILDFGLARRFAAPDTATVTASGMSFEAPGTIAGTLAYMAPEVLRGEPAGVRTDLWSLGVILYEMAAGRRPFSGQSTFRRRFGDSARRTDEARRHDQVWSVVSDQAMPRETSRGARAIGKRCAGRAR